MDWTDQTDSQNDKSYVIEPHRLEVVQGPTGRRRWSDREKARILAESYRGDASVSEVARRNGLRANQLFLWRQQAREGKLAPPAGVDDTMMFAPVVVADAGGRPPGGSAFLEIEAAGVVVRVCARTSAARIGEIAAALRSGR